ncbi:hypothetical protein niasHS_015885 [Heterodera schachtii]|uniref:Uncharacterized protein n=1 Tax=Heterodera schachtii TaxID=97005 RepID=A0ABD2HSD2_HETSC
MRRLRCSTNAPASGPMCVLNCSHIAKAVALVCHGGTSGRKITCIRLDYCTMNTFVCHFENVTFEGLFRDIQLFMEGQVARSGTQPLGPAKADANEAA